MESLPLLAATAGAFLLAGFIKGVIGMGLPTVAVGLLGLIMPPMQAAAILVVPALATNIWQFVIGGGLAALVRRLWPLFVGICIGTALAVVFLPRDASGQSTIWLGLALAVYAALGLVKIEFTVSPRHERWLGIVIGIATGVVTVATGIFVIPGMPYVQALRFERDRLVQALGLYFTVSTVTMAAALGHGGWFNRAIAVPSLVALIAALIGMALGQVVRGKVTPATFRLCFFLGLLALALHLMSRGLL